MKNWNKYLAEFLGTFALTLVVGLSLTGSFPVPTPVLAALTLAIFVYTVGHISGTHINPAITLAALSIKKIKGMDALAYWIAQFAGAGAAYWVQNASADLVAKYDSSMNIFHTAVLPGIDNPTAGLMEGLGAFFFAFGVAAVIYGRVPKDLQGIVVGASLLLGISIAAVYSNGILNPAVALGIGSFGVWYLIGPMIGAVLGMWTYKFLSGEK